MEEGNEDDKDDKEEEDEDEEDDKDNEGYKEDENDKDNEDDKEDKEEKEEDEKIFYLQKYLKLINILACQIWWGQANGNKLVHILLLLLLHLLTIGTCQTSSPNSAPWHHRRLILVSTKNNLKIV